MMIPEYEPMSGLALECALAQGRDLARVVRGHYQAFREVGFSKAEALELVDTWMMVRLSNEREA